MNWHRAFLGDPDWKWSFPEAFQPQYDFKTEWWWYGGHCYSGDRRFSYHAVLFRFSRLAELSKQFKDGTLPPDAQDSTWIAQWAITDHKDCSYHTGEMVVPDMPGLSVKPHKGHLSGLGTIGLSCGNAGSGLHLMVDLGAPVLQGDRGVTQKGQGVGEASYHFSCPQSRCNGQLRLGNEVFSVRGSTWFDREIGSDMFGGKEGSWTWLCASLNRGERISYYSPCTAPTDPVLPGSPLIIHNGLRFEPLHTKEFPSNLTAPYQELPCRIWKDQKQVGWGFIERTSGVLV